MGCDFEDSAHNSMYFGVSTEMDGDDPGIKTRNWSKANFSKRLHRWSKDVEAFRSVTDMGVMADEV